MQTATAVADHVEELAITSVSMLDWRVVVQEEVLVPRPVFTSQPAIPRRTDTTRSWL